MVKSCFTLRTAPPRRSFHRCPDKPVGLARGLFCSPPTWHPPRLKRNCLPGPRKVRLYVSGKLFREIIAMILSGIPTSEAWNQNRDPQKEFPLKPARATNYSRPGGSGQCTIRNKHHLKVESLVFGGAGAGESENDSTHVDWLQFVPKETGCIFSAVVFPASRPPPPPAPLVTPRGCAKPVAVRQEARGPAGSHASLDVQPT